VPEVIDDGITGFVVRGEAEAIQAIRNLSKLDRSQVRRHFEKRFTARRMAQEYLGYYEALVQSAADTVPADIRSVSPQRSAPGLAAP
jgi:glycosyltransferase involved in cell wall biosynthesis